MFQHGEHNGIGALIACPLKTYFVHDPHLGSALSHFLFRVLHDVHTCLICSILGSLPGVCIVS